MDLAHKKTLIESGNKIFQQYNKKDTHSFQPSAIIDIKINEELIADLKSLVTKIPDTTTFNEAEDVYLYELKNISEGTIGFLQDELSSETLTPEKIMTRFSVKKEDLEDSMAWILENKEKIIVANKMQFEKQNEKLTDINYGMADIMGRAQSLLQEKIEILNAIAKKMMLSNKMPDGFFDTYQVIPDIATNRSYANRIAQISAIATSSVVSYSYGKFKILWNLLFSQYGHEALGHGLNYYITDKDELPLFIKWGPFSLTSGIRESVAEYMEKAFYLYLTQNRSSMSPMFTDVNLDEVLNNIYEESLIMEYKNRLTLLGFWVMANSTQDKQNEQIKELLKYSISPSWPAYFTNKYSHDWNKSTGLLLPKRVLELKYSISNVAKAEKEFAADPKFVSTILTGFWTPKGFDAWVKYSLSRKVKANEELK